VVAAAAAALRDIAAAPVEEVLHGPAEHQMVVVGLRDKGTMVGMAFIREDRMVLVVVVEIPRRVRMVIRMGLAMVAMEEMGETTALYSVPRMGPMGCLPEEEVVPVGVMGVPVVLGEVAMVADLGEVIKMVPMRQATVVVVVAPSLMDPAKVEEMAATVL